MRVAPDFLLSVDRLCSAMIAQINDTSTEEATSDFFNDLLVAESLPGQYRVTAGGRACWEGETLAGAITAVLTMGLPEPQRIWHIDEEGNRRLVLTADGDDWLEER